MTYRVTAKKLGKLISQVGTRIAYVRFTKRDGTEREMYFQSHIPEYILVGGERVYDPQEHRLSWVFDIIEYGVRSIRWDAVEKMTIDHKTYALKKGHIHGRKRE